MASRALNGVPAAFGGVCGSVSAYAAITTDAPAAMRIGVTNASAWRTLPTMIPATVQPIVPSTRMIGKSRVESVTWWNEIELVSDSVGMYVNAYRMSSG